MSYFRNIIKRSMKLNSVFGMKATQKLMENNFKKLIVNFELDEVAAYNKKFLEKSFISKYGNRDYKLYIPDKKPLGLIVMLHGCKQNPDDFALGTEMNLLAEKESMLVLYPKQNSSYNQSKCWNWFKDDGSSIGESKIIYEMTKEVIKNYLIDSKQVYIAGMSAGGAMAVILATQHPDLYKAAGIHSGLPYKAATHINMALYSMKNGRDNFLGVKIKTPMIVFHGNKDETVAIKNAEQIINDIVSSYGEKVSTLTEKTNSYNVTYYKENKETIAEYWVVKNKGHVWSGGDAKGSYTSATGPNASKEMMRFFKQIGDC